MDYRLIGDQINDYSIYLGTPYTEFDAGSVFTGLLSKIIGNSYSVTVISERKGRGARKEALLEISFNNSTSKFYVYCFQTEGGGRYEDEARIQWREHVQWQPDLRDFAVCNQFATEVSQPEPELTNKECYVFAFYKRNTEDEDVLVSAIYPSSAKDKETLTSSPSSIQYPYSDIQRAYIKSISATSKGAGAPLIIHFHPSKLIWYMINRDRLHLASLEQFNKIVDESEHSASESTQTDADLARNKIIYGAPGTGKSYILNQQAQDLTRFITRVTFHSSYTYQNFIGTYRPTPLYKEITDTEKLFNTDKRTELSGVEKKEPLIDYTFVPGPLINLLVEAIKNTANNYLLIIEEINRANVSAVFGDFFQLLDRNALGESEYEIEPNLDVKNYIKSKGVNQDVIGFPKNLFIWATMNSADQGVMPLDSAFKRRWAFEYLPLDQHSSAVAGLNVNFQGQAINWNAFRNVINDRLKKIGVAEDKLIGPFFLKANELRDNNTIKNKLLLYLRDDVVRHNAQSLFKHSTFSDIVKYYDQGDEIFNGLTLPPPVSIPAPDTRNDSQAENSSNAANSLEEESTETINEQD